MTPDQTSRISRPALERFAAILGLELDDDETTDIPETEQTEQAAS